MNDQKHKAAPAEPAPSLPPPKPKHVDDVIAQAEEDHYRRLAARRAA